jgi:hypothetical protein
MASTSRLAAILAADVAGYSRLMGADEEGTHERLKAHFRQLIDPKIKEHQGRIVENTGDNRVLAEFPSSDGARVRKPRNPGGPRSRQDKRARQQADESSTMRNPEATDAIESEMTVGRLGAGAGSRAATAMLFATARGELVQGLDPD